jgi:hypothetical protein
LADNTMYKIQIVCQVDGVIDHVFEIIIKLNDEDNPVADSYKRFSYFQLMLKGSPYNIEPLTSMFRSNIAAYEVRISLIDDINSRHKLINHSARILYLLELFYQEKILLNSNIHSILSVIISFISLLNEKTSGNMYYYKRIITIDNTKETYQITQIPIKTIMNAYLGMFVEKNSFPFVFYKARTLFTNMIKKYPGFIDFITDDNFVEEYNKRHDDFLNMIKDEVVTVERFDELLSEHELLSENVLMNNVLDQRKQTSSESETKDEEEEIKFSSESESKDEEEEIAKNLEKKINFEIENSILIKKLVQK